MGLLLCTPFSTIAFTQIANSAPSGEVTPLKIQHLLARVVQAVIASNIMCPQKVYPVGQRSRQRVAVLDLVFDPSFTLHTYILQILGVMRSKRTISAQNSLHTE